MNTSPNAVQEAKQLTMHDASIAAADSVENSDWDLVITPSRSLLSLQLSDVWRYRDLLYLFVCRDILSFYKQTILGPLWFFVQPILTSLIYIMVFGNFAGLSTDGIPKLPFYLAGITFWNYFAECFNKTSETFLVNAHLFGKVYFPRLVMPLSIIVSNMVRFVIQFVLFLIVVGYFLILGQIEPNWTVLLFPFFLGCMAFIALGMGLIFSSLTTKYRDLRFVLQFCVQRLMYLTPVIYPLSMLKEKNYAWILAWNPLTYLMEALRYSFLGHGEFSMLGLAWSFTFAAIILTVGIVVFNHTERSFIDTI